MGTWIKAMTTSNLNSKRRKRNAKRIAMVREAVTFNLRSENRPEPSLKVKPGDMRSNAIRLGEACTPSGLTRRSGPDSGGAKVFRDPKGGWIRSRHVFKDKTRRDRFALT